MKNKHGNESPALTSYEQHVAELVATGITNKEIANILNVSEGAIKQAVWNAKRKCGLSRIQLVKYVFRDHDRRQAVRLLKWIRKWESKVPNECLVEINDIMAGQVASFLKT